MSELGERFSARPAHAGKVFGHSELVEGNRKDRPLLGHELSSALAVAGQIPEVLLELLGAQPLIAMAGEDRFDRGLLGDLVDNHDARPFHLCVTQSVHPAMQVLACRHTVTLPTPPAAGAAAVNNSTRSYFIAAPAVSTAVGEDRSGSKG